MDSAYEPSAMEHAACLRVHYERVTTMGGDGMYLTPAMPDHVSEPLSGEFPQPEPGATAGAQNAGGPGALTAPSPGTSPEPRGRSPSGLPPVLPPHQQHFGHAPRADFTHPYMTSGVGARDAAARPRMMNVPRPSISVDRTAGGGGGSGGGPVTGSREVVPEPALQLPAVPAEGEGQLSAARAAWMAEFRAAAPAFRARELGRRHTATHFAMHEYGEGKAPLHVHSPTAILRSPTMTLRSPTSARAPTAAADWERRSLGATSVATGAAFGGAGAGGFPGGAGAGTGTLGGGVSTRVGDYYAEAGVAEGRRTRAAMQSQRREEAAAAALAFAEKHGLYAFRTGGARMPAIHERDHLNNDLSVSDGAAAAVGGGAIAPSEPVGTPHRTRGAAGETGGERHRTPTRGADFYTSSGARTHLSQHATVVADPRADAKPIYHRRMHIGTANCVGSHLDIDLSPRREITTPSRAVLQEPVRARSAHYGVRKGERHAVDTNRVLHPAMRPYNARVDNPPLSVGRGVRPKDSILPGLGIADNAPQWAWRGGLRGDFWRYAKPTDPFAGAADDEEFEWQQRQLGQDGARASDGSQQQHQWDGTFYSDESAGAMGGSDGRGQGSANE